MKCQNLRLLDPSHVPRDGFPYVDEDTGYKSLGKSLPLIIKVATMHRIANGLSVPEDFSQQVETQICKGLPNDRCVCTDGTIRNITCHHRGHEIERMVCEPCGGRIEAIILSCAVHEKCTMFVKGQFDGVKLCFACRECSPID